MSRWLNTEMAVYGKNDIEKPCRSLGWCPYGPLVEAFPLTAGPLRCTVFGHDCPVYYHAEDMCEESDGK